MKSIARYAPDAQADRQFGMVPTSVVNLKLKPSALALYTVLVAKFVYGQTREATVPRPKLAKAANMHVTTVDRLLRQLVKAGLVVKTKRRLANGEHLSNVYSVRGVAAKTTLGVAARTAHLPDVEHQMKNKDTRATASALLASTPSQDKASQDKHKDKPREEPRGQMSQQRTWPATCSMCDSETEVLFEPQPYGFIRCTKCYLEYGDDLSRWFAEECTDRHGDGMLARGNWRWRPRQVGSGNRCKATNDWRSSETAEESA